MKINEITYGIVATQKTVAVVETATIPCQLTFPPHFREIFQADRRCIRIAAVTKMTTNVGIIAVAIAYPKYLFVAWSEGI